MKVLLKFLMILLIVSIAVFTGCDDTEDTQPELTGTITINGNAQVGQVLTIATTLTNITLQWERGVTPITGATNSSYTVHADDLGQTLRVVATRAGYRGNAVGGPTAPVIAAAPEPIDFTNYSDYAIRIKNDSGVNLVAFRGAPNAANLMGGIPANHTVHGLKRDITLFPNTGSSFDYVLFLVTEEDYLANRDRLPALENRPFTRLWAYHNVGTRNESILTVSGFLGGDFRIRLNNATLYNVELRRGSVHDGAIIGYVGAQSFDTAVFNVTAGVYTVFPVFRKFNNALGTIVSAFPKYPPGHELAGSAIGRRFELGNNMSETTLNAQEFSSDIVISAGAAFLIVQNNSSDGITLRYGGEDVTNESGGRVINSARSLTFPIYMDRLPGSEDQYLSSRELGQLSIYSFVTRTIPTFTFEEGKIYRIIVSGTGGSLSLSGITYEADWVF
jgi:hypothetical protein